MSRQILVPLKRHDRIDEIIPYLEEVAKAGMRVVFLIPYPVNSWLDRDVHLIMVRAGILYPLAQLLRRATLLFGSFRRPSPAPMLLLHTNHRLW